jgi:hypothetical protein
MAVKDTKKFLKNMRSFVDREYKRGALDKFSTIVTMTASACGEGFKEGYRDLLKKDPTLPVLTDAEFLKAGKAAVKAVSEWANKPRTKGTIVEDEIGRVVFRASRDIKTAYTRAKKAGSDEIQKILKSKGHRKLGGRDKAKGISARGSEVGILKSGIHRAHQGVTTVGAAQVSGALKFLEQTRGFGGFAASEEANEIADIISNIKATFNTTGTKSGSKATEVSLNENIDVSIEMLPRSKNPAGAEDYDLNKLLPDLEKAVLGYIKNADLATMSGSKSIEENAIDLTTYMVLKELSKSPNAKVVGRLKKPKGRKAKNTSEKNNYKYKKPTASNKKASALQKQKAKKSAAMQPLQLIGLINKKLPDTVRKNMQEPGLQNRTGRFAESVRLTDVIQTPKGYPSFGYTYQKNPYQVFEMGRGQAPWASPERDPRQVIDRSIREIAAQFAIGRFYTRRE